MEVWFFRLRATKKNPAQRNLFTFFYLWKKLFSMPLTRSAFQRYRLIDEAISRYPYQYSKKRLFDLCREKCGIRSISSLEKDIQTLREDHQAPIAYCKKRNGYYYQDPYFRLLKLMLTPMIWRPLSRRPKYSGLRRGRPVPRN
jgi:hypothetical protein